MTVLVFANGEETDVAWVRPYLASATALIAVDGGSRYLRALGVSPDVVVGDMDSLSPELRDWLDAADCKWVVYPAEKDETDLELALLHAVAQFDDEIWVVGAFGGRLDQMLGNVLLLAHEGLNGRRVLLVSAFQRAWLVGAGRETEVCGEVGDTVSLIPLGGDTAVRHTTGLKWALHDEVLAFGPARGVSNVLTAPCARVAVATGLLLVVHVEQRAA